MTKSKKITRRQAVALGLGTFASVGACQGLNRINQHQQQSVLLTSSKDRDFAVVGDAALKERAAAKKLLFGAATSYFKLRLDPSFANSFLKECSVLMAEGDLLWCAIRPSIDSFAFDRSDWLVEFAQSQNLVMGATHLVWHHCMPGWFKETVNQQNAQQIMLDHIKTVVGRYAGKIHYWSVINEAVNPGDHRDNGLGNTPWLDFLGPDYIEIGFRAAAEADPQALLLINDTDLELDIPYQDRKRAAVLKLLESLKSKGVPVHGLGIQAHIDPVKGKVNPQKLKDFLSSVADLGLKIAITEMDIVDANLPNDVDTRDRIVAQYYEDLLSAFLDAQATVAVTTWGLSDRFTWVATAREDGAPARPLPLDAFLNRKLAWNAIARAFDESPKRDSSSSLWNSWENLNQETRE